jgi:hypothetical protein
MDYTTQMARDIGLVLDNREDTHIPIQNYADKEPSLVEMSNYIADIYYTAVNEALDYLENSARLDLGRELLHEIALRIGTGVFDDLASDYLEGA